MLSTLALLVALSGSILPTSTYGSALPATIWKPPVTSVLGIGARANVLSGGSGRPFALQPLSPEGLITVNIVSGVSMLNFVLYRRVLV